MSSTTSDTGNTCNGTTGSPGLGTGLVTCFVRHSVWLSFVLGHVGVNEVEDVGPDGSRKDCW